MLTNMKVGGLASIYQVCIVDFLVFWGPGKFGIKKVLGLTLLSPRVTMSLFYRSFSHGGFPLLEVVGKHFLWEVVAVKVSLRNGN